MPKRSFSVSHCPGFGNFSRGTEMGTKKELKKCLLYSCQNYKLLAFQRWIDNRKRADRREQGIVKRPAKTAFRRKRALDAFRADFLARDGRSQ